MKIVMALHQFFPRHQTGVEVATRNLARELSARHQLTLFYREHQPDEPTSLPAVLQQQRATVEGLDVLRVSRRRPSLRSPLGLFADYYRNADIEGAFERLLDRVSPDIVHIQHLMHLSGGIIDAAVERRIPVVVTLHDYWYICANAQLVRPSGHICRGSPLHLWCGVCAAASVGQRLLMPFGPAAWLLFFRRERYLRRKLAKVALFLSPSDYLKEEYVERGFPEHRIVIVENGIDVTGVMPRKPRDPGLPVRFTYLGSIAWQKGVHVLVEAFNEMPATAELTIYGDFSVFPDYTARLREFAHNPSIEFRGPLPHHEIWRVLSETDVLVVPSLWYENSPMVILEAFAAGVPVVASRIGALTEKVREGVDGLLFSPGHADDLRDKLTSLAAAPGAIEDLRRNIRPVPSVESQARQVELIYRRLVDGKGLT